MADTAEENRRLRIKLEALEEEVAVLRIQAKSDQVELTALRDQVRRLNNEAMASRAGVPAPLLSRGSSAAVGHANHVSTSPPAVRAAAGGTATTGTNINLNLVMGNRVPKRDPAVPLVPEPAVVRADSPGVGTSPRELALRSVKAEEDVEEGEESKSPRGAGFFTRFRKPVSPRSGSSDKAMPHVSPQPQQSQNSSSSALAAAQAAVLAAPPSVSAPTNALQSAGSAASDGGFSVSILSSMRVGKNVFFLLGFRKSKGDEFVIVPRLYQDFRDLHSALVKQFGDVIVPELKRIGSSEKETQSILQVYLDHISHYHETAVFPAFRDEFLDPLFSPSYYTLTEVLKASRHGRLQVMVGVNRTWKSHACVLLDSFYIFRSEEDVHPLDTTHLEWITIEIVTVKQEPAPPVVFKILNLEHGTETFLGCDSTKEVGEWILALREAKFRKKGDGFWHGTPKEDALVVPESVVKRRAEVEAGAGLFREWLESKDHSFFVKHTATQMAMQLDATAIPVNYEQEAILSGSKTAMFRSRGEGMPLQIAGGTRQRFLALLLGSANEEELQQPVVAPPVAVAAAVTADVGPVEAKVGREKALEDIESLYGDETKFDDMLQRSPRSPRQEAQAKKPLPAVPKEDTVDTTAFVDQFVLVYRLFLSAQELFLTIATRFLSASDERLRLRCCLVLHKLVQYHWSDVARDTKLARSVAEFVTAAIEPRYPEMGKAIRQSIAERAIDDKRARKEWLKSAPKALLPDMYQRNTFDFIDLNPVEVARQLSILEHNLFSAIEGCELLNQCWNKEQKEIDAPNVTLTIRRFNQMSGWITSLIVKVKPLKPRVALLRRFIDIADACRQLNNFNSVVEIISGLQTTAVRRLTDTFDALPAESTEILTQMREFLETRKNWEKYRTRLNGLVSVAGVACVPYLGLYLTDLVMIDEALKKTVPHSEFPEISLLNWERASRIAAVHGEIRRFQAERYRLNSISYLQEYLSRLDQMEEEECYERSLQIQPRKT